MYKERQICLIFRVFPGIFRVWLLLNFKLFDLKLIGLRCLETFLSLFKEGFEDLFRMRINISDDHAMFVDAIASQWSPPQRAWPILADQSYPELSKDTQS